MSQFTATFSASRSACGGCGPRCGIAPRTRATASGLQGRETSQLFASDRRRESSREADSKGILAGMGGNAGAQEVLGSVRVLLVEDDRLSGMIVEQHLL